MRCEQRREALRLPCAMPLLLQRRRPEHGAAQLHGEQRCLRVVAVNEAEGSRRRSNKCIQSLSLECNCIQPILGSMGRPDVRRCPCFGHLDT